MRKFHMSLEKDISEELKKDNLTLFQSYILMFLYMSYGGDSSFKCIEKDMGLPQSTVIGMIKKLSEKGLIFCYSDESDKRVKRMKLTEKGEKICLNSIEKADKLGSKMFDALSEEEVNIFFMLLRKICNSADERGM